METKIDNNRREDNMITEHPNFPTPNDNNHKATCDHLRAVISEHLDRYVLVGFDEHGVSVMVGSIPDEASRVALNRMIVRAVIPPNTTGKI
jgi:hypothetical protein